MCIRDRNMVEGDFTVRNQFVRNWFSVRCVSMIGSSGLFRVVIQSMDIPSGVTCTVWFVRSICLALHFGWTAHMGLIYLDDPRSSVFFCSFHRTRVLKVLISMCGPESACWNYLLARLVRIWSVIHETEPASSRISLTAFPPASAWDRYPSAVNSQNTTYV